MNSDQFQFEYKLLESLQNSEEEKERFPFNQGIAPTSEQPMCECDSLITDNGYDVCSKCGLVDIYKCNFQSSYQSLHAKSTYKRIQHFTQIIRNIRGHSLKQKFSKEEMNAILKRIGTKKITLRRLREAVIELRFNHLLNQLSGLYAKISNNEAAFISIAEETQLIKLFKIVSIDYEKAKKKERKNFFNYHFLLYNFAYLINRNDLFEFIKLTKNEQLLKENHKLLNQILENHKLSIPYSIYKCQNKRKRKSRKRLREPPSDA